MNPTINLTPEEERELEAHLALDFNSPAVRANINTALLDNSNLFTHLPNVQLVINRLIVRLPAHEQAEAEANFRLAIQEKIKTKIQDSLTVYQEVLTNSNNYLSSLNNLLVQLETAASKATTWPSALNGLIRRLRNDGEDDKIANLESYLNLLIRNIKIIEPDTLRDPLIAFIETLRGLHANIKWKSTPLNFADLTALVDDLDLLNKTFAVVKLDGLLTIEERYSNIFVEFTPAAPPAPPLTFYHPEKTPNSTTPYLRGRAFVPEDYTAFFKWYLVNKNLVTDDVKTAVETLTRQFKSTILTPDTDYLSSLNPAIINDDVVMEQVVLNLLNPSVPRTLPAGYAPASTVFSTETVPPLENEVNLTLAALAFNIDTDGKSITEIRQELCQKYISKVRNSSNVPTDNELAEHLDSQREGYALAIKKNPINKAQSRSGLLSSTRAKVKIEILNQFKDKELNDTESKEEFVKATANAILSERLKTINSLFKKRSKWYNNIPSKLGISLAPTVVGGGLLGSLGIWKLAETGAGKSLGAVGTKISGWFKAVTAAGPVKLLQTGLGFAGGFLVGRQLSKFFNYGPFSAARQRDQNSVLGEIQEDGTYTGGLGRIDRTTGNYDGTPVQEALAAQLNYAQKFKDMTIATEHSASDDFSMFAGTPEKQQERFQTSNHLWKRERMGLENIIRHSLNSSLADQAIPDKQKNSHALVTALDKIYSSRHGTETTFMQALEGRSPSRQSWAHNIVGVALGSAITYTI